MTQQSYNSDTNERNATRALRAVLVAIGYATRRDPLPGLAGWRRRAAPPSTRG